MLKQRTEPWMSTEILNLIKERDESLSTFEKCKRPEDYKHFCKLRNKVQREIKLARYNYISGKIEENRNEPRKLWKQLKDLEYIKIKLKIVLNIDNESCHDSKTIVDNFNHSFYDSSCKTGRKIT